MASSVDFDCHLVKMPASSTVRLTVTEFLTDERSEFDTPITKRFVTDGHATLEKKFLRIAVTQVETVIQPNRMLDDAGREAMAVWFLVWHEQPAYQLT